MTTPPPPSNDPTSGQPSWSNAGDNQPNQPSWTQPPKKKSKKPWIFGGIGAVVLLLIIAAIAGGGESDEGTTKAAASSVSTVTAAPSTVTVEATTTVAPTQSSTPAPAPVAPRTTSAVPGGVMPDVMCMNLQAAQNLIQENGVFFSRSDDASGEGRMQVVDSNWIVVSQTPEAGATITEGEAVLSVVKIDEPSDC
jgi:hypothetical protein